jgi:tRNA/tmRNA/rRNA uracil-C5-methylase (TrmA/RlmC/RlmD family)
MRVSNKKVKARLISKAYKFYLKANSPVDVLDLFCGSGADLPAL